MAEILVSGLLRGPARKSYPPPPPTPRFSSSSSGCDKPEEGGGEERCESNAAR